MPGPEGASESPRRSGQRRDPKPTALARQVITLAFSGDPVARWIFPGAHSYLVYFPDLVRAFGGKALETGSAHVLDGFRGAALWLPPGVAPDEPTLLELIQRSVAEELQDDVLGVFEQMEAYHPREPHWYLALIGVDPAHQRKGYGSILLRRALAVCDREGRLAYLESSNPENIPLYERHGFEVIGKIQVGSSPPITPMLREPRSRGCSAFGRG